MYGQLKPLLYTFLLFLLTIHTLVSSYSRPFWSSSSSSLSIQEIPASREKSRRPGDQLTPKDSPVPAREARNTAKMEGFPLVVLYLGILLVPSLLFSTLKRFTQLNSADSTSPSKPGKFPGPKQYPIIGRVHDLPRFGLWLKFKEWADEFGPIYQTSMLGQKFVIISQEKMAQELLVKNGNNFAGRPQIRALINHKAGPVYSALMDRHGKNSPGYLEWSGLGG